MRASAAEGGGTILVAGDTQERGDLRGLRERRAQQKFMRAHGGRGIVGRVGEALGLCSACEAGRGF